MNPNSHECIYFGRKLSNIEIPEIRVFSDGEDRYCCIGSDNDDSIYLDEAGAPELTERVKIYASSGVSDVEIDLEDVIRFAVKYCRGIVDRVMEEEK